MSKSHLLLLHGALGSKVQMQSLVERMSKHYQVHSLNFSGHGGRELPEGYNCDLFADDIRYYLDEQGIEQAHIFGYSMGGYAAVYFALKHPERVDKLATLATKYFWDAAGVAQEVKMLNSDKIEEKVPAFAKALQERHAPQDWKQVLRLTAEIMTSLGENPALNLADMQQLQHEILVMVGDRDHTAGLEDSIKAYQNFPNARLFVLPATPHPLEKTDLTKLEAELCSMLN